jgi:hypothetical protein
MPAQFGGAGQLGGFHRHLQHSPPSGHWFFLALEQLRRVADSREGQVGRGLSAAPVSAV